MRFAARAALGVGLLVGVYVLALAMVLGVAVVVYQGFAHGFGGVLLGKGAGLLLLLALALGRAFWAVARLGRQDVGGLSLTPAEEPALWDAVRALAEAVGTRAPDEIRLVPEVNAWVQEDSKLLGLVSGRRVMGIGAPLLMGVSYQQAHAVMAHELGHYSHRHTAFGSIVYRGHVTLALVVDRLGADTLTGAIFAAYGRLYVRLTHAVTRRQELEADLWSARLAGRGASLEVMRRVPALTAAWEHFLGEYAFRLDGVRPEGLFAGFRSMLEDPARRRQLEELQGLPPDDWASPYDTHPSQAVRLGFLESLPEDDVEDEGVPALGLLRNGEVALARLETEMFADTEREVRSWDWIASRVALARAREYAAQLVRAATEPGRGARDLRQAIGALGRGGHRQLVGAVLPDDAPPGEVTSLARSLVTAAVCVALVEHAGARFTIDWSSLEVLVDPEGKRIDVRSLVEGVTSPAAGDDLLSTLADEGVPGSFSVDPATVDFGTERNEPSVHSVAVCMRWPRMRVLVVADSGLILKRMSLAEGFVAAMRHRRSDGYRNALLYVSSMPLPRLLEDSRTEHFPWERVGPVALSGRRLSLTLDGRRHRTSVKPHAVAGDLLGSLRLHLGERVAVPRL